MSRRPTSAKELFSLFKEGFQEFIDDGATRLAAALSYYTVFSLAPMLVILVALAGLFFGQEAARGEIVSTLGGVMGPQAAGAIETMIENSSRDEGGVLALVLGIVTLVIGATGAFAQLQAALNEVWSVEAAPGSGLVGILRKRLLSFGMVLVIGVLMMLLLAASAVLSGAADSLFGSVSPLLLRAAELAGAFVLVSVLFAIIFRWLPDVEISWRDVSVGAASTAVLFVIGKYLIGLYLGHSSVGSSYGAAGSLAVLLVWIYYSSAILLFGAELTEVWARHYGDRILPDDHAVRVVGMPSRDEVEGVSRHEPREAHHEREG